MTAAHQQLVDLIVSSLMASPAVAAGTVFRQRKRAIAASVQQAVCVRIVSSGGRSLKGSIFRDPVMPPTEWLTSVAVDCVARVAPGQATDAAVADLLDLVHQRITQSAALATAGYIVSPDHSLDWDQEDMDESISGVSALYTIRHTTPPRTLSV